MQHTNNVETLKTVALEFINTSNEILEVYKGFPTQLTLKEDFSIILIRIYQQIMLDVFPSAQVLVHNQNFVSFSILCRSIFDIIIQLTWLLSLDNTKKAKAIKCFLEFDGIFQTKNGRHEYEWQLLIDKKYSLRKAAIDVGIDKEILDLPVKKFYRESIENDLVVEINGVQLKLTVFDYLSKITHWNPRFLCDLVGFNKSNHLGYTNEYVKMCIIALPTFISCVAIFADIFCRHFFEDKNNNLKKLQKIKASFEKAFVNLINNSQVNLI